ncbi:uncharacterized protein FOMMEDRAFT_88233 [Fomitiporia mediterranea MF3/22]|uniref:uncharacterized protein n=1 Tax=Fomitiporia mediterranea (strain MF3/22) TaxID=694068 RepID=UPI0004408770|nr:uncharacterized protein FOMMEDRAFT_88233 [Fomitiporia mediterranea MF3/22]EJD01850.1 hypothetical protein FOMMEDRAFT_88233 [Fomitiporia mediterranea MF3/22]
MRFTITLLFAGVASAFLVSRQNVPQCALTCIGNADLGGCSATDNQCLCTNQQFIQSTTTCIESTCSGSDLAAAEAFAQQSCASVGVTLTAPGSASATQTSANPSGSGSNSATSTGSNSASTP